GRVYCPPSRAVNQSSWVSSCACIAHPWRRGRGARRRCRPAWSSAPPSSSATRPTAIAASGPSTSRSSAVELGQGAGEEPRPRRRGAQRRGDPTAAKSSLLVGAEDEITPPCRLLPVLARQRHRKRQSVGAKPDIDGAASVNRLVDRGAGRN